MTANQFFTKHSSWGYLAITTDKNRKDHILNYEEFCKLKCYFKILFEHERYKIDQSNNVREM